MFDYINIIYWVIALASLIAWARFATFVGDEVKDRLRSLPEAPWKLGMLLVLFLMLVVYVAMPSFWLAFPINIIIAGVAIGIFWKKRVQLLGAEGHLFGNLLALMSGRAAKKQQKKNAAQVSLEYLQMNGNPLSLPKSEDPLSAGLPTTDQLLMQAIARRAERVDLAPSEAHYGVLMVTDGFPYHQEPLQRTEGEAALQALKHIAGLSVEERRRPQAGTFRTRDVEGHLTTWTIHTSGSTSGERLSIGVDEKGRWDFKVAALGLSTDQLAELKTVTADSNGTVLVAAPKGQGRTSTLYALLREHDAFTHSINTLEIKPQAEIEGVTTITYDSRNTEVPFSKTLHSLVLKDPNIVMLDAIPDQASADILTRFASETAISGPGHRVYAGMAANDTFTALDAWMAMNTDKAGAINTLRAIIAQRLVRTLCSTCKVAYQPDEATLKRLNLPVGRNLQAFKANTGPIVDEKGKEMICPSCGGSGYRGRTGIFEVLILHDDVRKVILGKGNHAQIKAAARKHNFVLLVENGIRKFATGVTAINEVTRVLNTEKGGSASQKSGVSPAQK